MEFSISKSAPSHWAIKAIADVCERVTSGGTPSRKNPEFFQNGSWPWVKTQELNDCWIDDTEEHITDAAVEASSAKVLPANTVLMAMYGATVGQLGILRRPMTCNQASCAMVTDERKAHFRYLYYLLLSQREQIKSLSTGAAQQNLSGMQIKQFRLPFPEVGEQRAIAHILGTLDDKIELNRRMNETLEAMARAIFKSWFVDFDPVRAKASGEPPESICRRLGLTAELLALFPDQLQESALGAIPSGWETSTLGEHIEIFDSKRVPLSNREREQRKGPYPYYGAASIMDYVDDFLFDGIYVLMGEDGSVVKDDGKPVLQYAWGKYWVNNHAHVLAAKPPLTNEHLLLALQGSNIAPYVTGAVQPKLSQGNLRRIPFLSASPVLNAAFGALIEPLFALIRAREEESSTLRSLRDSLLPRLISGEIPVI